MCFGVVRGMSALIALLVAATALACAGGPPVHHPALESGELPATFTARSSAGRAPGRWWQRFNDPGLEKAIALAMKNNSTVNGALARMQASAAQARAAGAETWPTLSAELAPSRTRRNFLGFPSFGGGSTEKVFSTISSSFVAQLSVSWELDLWGRVRSATMAAGADSQAAQADARGAALSIIGQVCKLWFEIIDARAQVGIARETLRTRERSHQQALERYRNGVVPAASVRAERALLESARAALMQRQDAAQRLVRRLEVVIGLYPHGTLRTGEKLPADAGETPAGLPSDLLFRRPDLVARERRLAAAGARIHEARAALLPRISLTAGGGRSSEELSDLTLGAFNIWNIAGGVVAPLFQGGRLIAGLDMAKAKERAALADYRETLARALFEVESGLEGEGLQTEIVEKQERAFQESTASLESAQRRYQEGVLGAGALLDAQRAMLAARSRLVSARRARLVSRVDLYLALGGGFASGNEEPAAPDESPGKSQP